MGEGERDRSDHRSRLENAPSGRWAGGTERRHTRRLKALNAGVVPTNSNAKSGGVSDHPPYRRIYESGTRACLGTDALNVSPYPPFLNLWYVISGKTTVPGVAGVVAEQRLTRQEALRLATERCGWFIDLEGKVGVLAPGNYADLIVLNKDYFAVPEDEIRTLTSVLTLVRGRIVYADAEYAGLDQPLAQAGNGQISH